jgi:hypothetical protein
MKEKGQVWIIFAGLLLLIAIFCVGWFVGHRTAPTQGGIDVGEIEIIPQGVANGDKHESKIEVDNCRSSVPSTIEDTREFAYQQLFTVNINNEFGAGFKNAVYLKLEKTYGFQNGNVGKTSRNFQFVSPPGAKSIHVITWFEKLKTGYVSYEGRQYPFMFPEDVQVSSISWQEVCP